MSATRLCSQCQQVLPDGVPEGLCSSCLLAIGMQSSPEKTLDFSTSAYQGQSALPKPDELQPLLPQFEIMELLGQGGMGAVFKARQITLDRMVALKILPQAVGRDPAFAERFLREARALARLNHPHIVTIHDFGQAGGFYFIIMEYVDGINLRQAIRTKTLSSAQALKIVPQICEALQFAHDEGIVHRDIKPENILLDKKGRVKMADFGLAKLLGVNPSEISLTRTQQAMGTLHYMAPEQIEGARDVDHRADIFSLGVTFYEMLTGELPLGRFAVPSKKAPIDVRLDEVVLKTLEKEPNNRYQHASDLKTDVDKIRDSAVPITDPHGIQQLDHSTYQPKSNSQDSYVSDLDIRKPSVDLDEIRDQVAKSGTALLLAGAVIMISPFLVFMLIFFVAWRAN